MGDSLRKNARRRGLANIKFSPLVPTEQLSAAMAEGDIHLVPQLASGGDFAVPSKAFTIMAAGRPFIATAAAGSPLARLAQASGAFLCTPPDSPEAFADAVIDLMADEPLRQAMGRKGRAYAMAEADTEVVMRRLAPFLGL